MTTVDIYNQRDSEVTPVRDQTTSTSQESLAAAITNYQATLYRIALRMLGNVHDAEDALQDALLLAFRNVSQFKGEAQMTTWLAAILVNSARMFIRRRCARKTLSLHQLEEDKNISAEEAFVDARPGPEELCGKAEQRRKLQNASERLSPTVRNAFQLVVLNGLSMREAAQILGVSEGTVKARVFHGRKQVLRIVKRSTLRQTSAKSRAASVWREHRAPESLMLQSEATCASV